MLLILLAIVIGLPWWLAVQARRVTLAEEEIGRLRRRVDTLSSALAALRQQREPGADSVVAPPAAAAASPTPAPDLPALPVPDPVAAQTPLQGHAADRPVAVRPSPSSKPTDEAPTPAAIPPSPPAAVVAPASTRERTGEERIVEPYEAPREAAPNVGPPRHDSSLEAQLGTNWLNKLGAVLLVVGVAFFLTYQLRTLGPLGKVMVGYAAGAALLAVGIVAERRTEYRMFSRGVMAAGWALAFFTTFAMYHVPAARVIDSQTVDLVLMLVVAGGMVGHAVRYRSETVTGLAFLLAFATVAISHEAAFTLSAGLVLAIASAAIAVSMRWSALEVGAVVAAYINYLLSSAQLDAAAAQAAHFDTSLALLLAYWATFRLAYVASRNETAESERWSAFAAVLNTGGVVAAAGHYLSNPDLFFTVLICLAIADAALAWFARRRRLAFATLVTMSAAAIAAAIPIRFGPRTVTVAWFIEAEALVAIGVRSRDGLFTRLGILASAVAGLYVYVAEVVPLMQARSLSGPHPGDPAVALILLSAAAVYYFNSLRVLPSRPEAFARPVERVLTDKLSYAGALALAGAAWALLPPVWLAPAFLAIALGLTTLARRLSSIDLWVQGQAAALVGVAVLVAVNFDDVARLGPVHRRLVVVLLVAAAHHALYWPSRLKAFRESPLYGAAHSWIGSALIATIAWYELAPLTVVSAWAAGALIALEVGIRARRRDLRIQAGAALAAAFARIFVVNLNGSGGLLGSAVVTTAPLALVLFYVHERIASDEALYERRWVPGLIAAAGTMTLAAMTRVALAPSLVALSWSVLVLLLAATALLTGRRLYMRQAAAGALAVCCQAVAVNIYGSSHLTRWWSSPWFAVGSSIALLLAALPIARRMRVVSRPAGARGAVGRALGDFLSRRPDVVLFFAPLGLLVWLSSVHASGGLVTMAWGLEAVSAFVLALWMRERSFRLGALGLLLACVLRITLVDVWRLNQQGRYLSFITLGSALLLVSFLYSRYRESLEDYL